MKNNFYFSHLGCADSFQVSCYDIFYDGSDKETLGDARSNCETSGKHLVYIETSEEQEFLDSELGNSNKDFWIGIKKDLLGNQVWMDDTPITFDNFLGYSFNDNGECFRMKRESVDTTEYPWVDRSCSHDYKYICERSLGKIVVNRQ